MARKQSNTKIRTASKKQDSVPAPSLGKVVSVYTTSSICKACGSYKMAGKLLKDVGFICEKCFIKQYRQ